MSSTKITERAAAGAITGAEVLGVIQGAVDRRTTVAEIGNGVNVTATGLITSRSLSTRFAEYPSINDFGITGTADDSSVFQSAASTGGTVLVPAGTYLIFTVTVSQSITFICEPGVIFQRKANTDVASGSYTTASAGMFNVTAGVTLTFDGEFTYDGNKANQTTTEPTGFFARLYTVGAQAILKVRNGRFINGTSGYILVKGDGSARSYRTLIYLEDCRFFETIMGIGKGDPSTPNALGYSPNYVALYNYVDLYANNFQATWDTALTTGQYAVVAIWGSYSGVEADGGVSVQLSGRTYLKGMGRSGKKYNDDADYSYNNGIGAIDLYGNADLLFVEHVTGVSNENVTVRAKASLKYFTVMSAVLTNCHRGIQCGPSSTGAAETSCYVGTVTSNGGTVPQVEFTGTASNDRIRSVVIGHIDVEGALTDPEVVGNTGAVQLENIESCHVGYARINGSPTYALYIQNSQLASIGSLIIEVCSGPYGVFYNANDLVILQAFNIQDCTGGAIGFANSSVKAALRDGYVHNCVNYAVFGNDVTSDILCDNIEVGTITGSNRGFYKGNGGRLTVKNCKALTVATPILLGGTSAKLSESSNSWNGIQSFGSAAPTTGTWVKGDIVWDSTPDASGFVGWICTTAGTPGTWKTFGAISA